jgi:hypothetical protein
MWSSRHLLAAVFCASFLTVQIAVPIVQLASPRPARFGWHMWTARRRAPQFSVVMKDGSVRPADVSIYLASSRGEMDAGAVLPPHLCRVIPDIAAVEIRARGSNAVQLYRCP